MLRYHLFSPGGNLTALVDEPVSPFLRVDTAATIMAHDPTIEQVGFIVPPDNQSHDFVLEMMGGELCVNAARSAALFQAQRSGKKEVVFKLSGSSVLVKAMFVDGKDNLILPSSLLIAITIIPEGKLVVLQGITFIITEDLRVLEDPRKVITKYDDGLVPAIGVIHVEKRSEDQLTIKPWVWVRGTGTFLPESACGSGSIAACLAQQNHVSTFTVRQPSGSVYEIILEQCATGLASISIGGLVDYIGEETFLNTYKSSVISAICRHYLPNFMAPCLYCGNNPTSHRLTWFNTFTVVLMTPFNRYLATSRIGQFFNWLTEVALFGMLHSFRLVGLVKFYNKKDDCTIARARALWDDAELRGIKMEGATFLGKQIDFYRAVLKGKQLYFNGLPRPEQSDSTALLWMDDKGILKEKLLAAQLPVAAGGSFSDYETLLAVFQTLQKPVIIKPRLGSRGRHTTTCIYTEAELRQAFGVAKQLCNWVVMEEHLYGGVYRGTMIGGKLRGVLGANPPRIIGDGTHTIADLVALQNASKPTGVKDIKINQATLEFLLRNGYVLETVLPAGTVIDLTEKVGVSYGGSSFEITSEVHPDVVVALEKAAAVVGDVLLGFDFIIPDVTKSPAEQKWGIIECNAVPFINLHHYPLLGKPNNVAKYVWEMVE